MSDLIHTEVKIIKNQRSYLKRKLKADEILKQKVKDKINLFYKYMRSKRYADQSIKTYISVLIKFFIYYKEKQPDEITNQDIINYNNDFILKNDLSPSYQNQLINAIKLFYEKVYNKKLIIENIERPIKARPLPKVLSKEDIKKIIDSISNLKHKTIISLIYSAGLRRRELINMKIIDIDSKRKIITVNNSKGNKDRIVGLSEKILQMLIKYYKKEKPKEYLFEGQNGGKYSATSIQKIFKKAKIKSGINIKGGVHLLRHSFATHLHESGIDIRTIQEILGHKSTKTTEIYTHVSTKSIKNVKSPFDDLEI
ncbi:MAG: site-specific integrase [Bacteroidales bacterium]|nr:site-specific integrase [Bacteroidales bacterium]